MQTGDCPLGVLALVSWVKSPSFRGPSQDYSSRLRGRLGCKLWEMMHLGGDLEFPFTTGPRTKNPLRKMVRGYIGAARDLGYKDTKVAQALGVRCFCAFCLQSFSACDCLIAQGQVVQTLHETSLTCQEHALRQDLAALARPVTERGAVHAEATGMQQPRTLSLKGCHWQLSISTRSC